MATATSSPDAALALTQGYKAQQNRLGALIALLVATYYRQRVNVEDPASVAKWLDLMIPRILQGSSAAAILGARFATDLRALELPDAPALTFGPSVGAVEEQIRKSLQVVGPFAYENKAREIRTLDVPDVQKQALLAEAKQVTSQTISSATMRHVQNGGRQTIADATKEDRLALGYVRVTKAKPCFFCAMLASRGVVFADDSFADSDPRFVGNGTAKVHDHCECALKAVYDKKTDKVVQQTELFSDMWKRWGKGQGNDSVNLFRKGYDLWLTDGIVRDLSDFA